MFLQNFTHEHSKHLFRQLTITDYNKSFGCESYSLFSLFPFIYVIYTNELNEFTYLTKIKEYIKSVKFKL